MFEAVNVKEITSRVYLLDESGESTGYLVVGSKMAVLIDTMNGGEDLKALAKHYTDLPVMVVNTHGHCDHIAGNIYFEEAWIHPADFELAMAHISFEEMIKFCEEKDGSMPTFKFLEDGQVIDLGDLTLQVIWMPGHTQGSILLLLKEERILFTGDAINRHLWMQLGDSTDLETLAQNLDKVMYLTGEADIILHGHTRGAEPISLIKDLRAGVQEILDGKVEDDKPYKWFDAVDMQHAYGPDKNVICYKKGAY